jgi:opacity protein-like surface antigen
LPYFRRRILTSLSLVLLGGATLVQAQVVAQAPRTGAANANRWGTGEFYIGTSTFATTDARLDYAPVDIEFDNAWAFIAGGGYHLSEHLYIGGEMTFASTGFSGYGNDPETGEESVLDQDLREWGFLGGIEYYLLKGPVTPYVSAGLGLTYLETRVPDADPELICVPGFWQWWCYWTYPVYSDWAFTYYAGAGIRWDINARTVMRLAYRSNWIHISNLQSTSRQDVVSLTIGGRF